MADIRKGCKMSERKRLYNIEEVGYSSTINKCSWYITGCGFRDVIAAASGLIGWER